MIAIIGAMERELTALKERMSVQSEEKRAGMTFYTGTLHGRDLVVVQSGIGKVNAGICAQILVDCYDAELIILTGVAGSLDARINIGDIVIATDAVQHDMDAGGIGDPAGQVPGLDVFAFPIDERIGMLAESVNRRVNPDIGTFRGRILTGDQFVADREKKNQMVAQFGGLCCEMEGAAAAQTAYLNQVPCILIRAISDKADDSADMDFPAFTEMAVRHTMNLLDALIKEL